MYKIVIALLALTLLGGCAVHTERFGYDTADFALGRSQAGDESGASSDGITEGGMQVVGQTLTAVSNILTGLLRFVVAVPTGVAGGLSNAANQAFPQETAVEPAPSEWYPAVYEDTHGESI